MAGKCPECKNKKGEKHKGVWQFSTKICSTCGRAYPTNVKIKKKKEK